MRRIGVGARDEVLDRVVTWQRELVFTTGDALELSGVKMRPPPCIGRELQVRPVRYDYRLTPKGDALTPALVALTEWCQWA